MLWPAMQGMNPCLSNLFSNGMCDKHETMVFCCTFLFSYLSSPEHVYKQQLRQEI